MAVDAKQLEQYRNAAEALLDALTVFEARLHTRDEAEYNRLQQLIERCQADLDRFRREFEHPDEPLSNMQNLP